MFTLVQNYKKMFLFFIRNEFAEAIKGAELEDNNNSGYTVDELIKKSLEDGEVDKGELLKIKEKYEEEKNQIGNEVKKKINEFLRKIEEEMLNDGISIEGMEGFDKLKARFEELGYTIHLAPSLAYKIDFAKKHNKKLGTIHIDGSFDGKILKLGIENGKIAQLNNDYINEDELEEMGYDTDFLETSINEDNIAKAKRVEAERIESERITKEQELEAQRKKKVSVDTTLGGDVSVATVGESDILVDTSSIEKVEVASIGIDATSTSKNSTVTQPEIKTQPEFQSDTPTEEITYTVKSGDTLWQIVRDHYGLTNNKEITRMVNFIVDNQEEGRMKSRLQKDIGNDGIKGDKLWIGDVIKLPVMSDNISAIKKQDLQVESKEKDEQIKIKHSTDSDKLIYALDHLEEGANPKEGNAAAFEIGEYSYNLDGKEVKNTITLKQFMGNKYVELDGTSFWNDMDLKVSGDKRIEEVINELVNKYQTKINNKD